MINEAGIIIAVCNIVAMVGNLIMGYRTNNSRYWKEKFEELNSDCKDLSEKKDQYKIQFINLLTKYKKVEGEVRTYRQFHKHDGVEP